MAGVVPYAGQLGNQRGNARQGPQNGGVPVRERAPQQFLLHLVQLGAGELGLAPSPTDGLQSRFALPLPSPVPVVRRRPTRLQGARHLSPRLALRKQPRRFQPPLLQTSKIPFAASVQFHARDMP
jgi:hypothetical protein